MDADDRFAHPDLTDRETFSDAFRHFYAPLCRYARGIVGRDEEASDVVQEVFVRLWERRERLTISQSLQALLYTMTRNRALNQLRRRKHEMIATEGMDRLPVQASGEPPGDTLVDADALRDHLAEWTRALPPRQAEALQLSRMHGLRHHEIADIMGISKRTVDTHILLALRALRRRLDAYQKEGIRP